MEGNGVLIFGKLLWYPLILYQDRWESRVRDLWVFFLPDCLIQEFSAFRSRVLENAQLKNRRLIISFPWPQRRQVVCTWIHWKLAIGSLCPLVLIASMIVLKGLSSHSPLSTWWCFLPYILCIDRRISLRQLFSSTKQNQFIVMSCNPFPFIYLFWIHVARIDRWFRP